MRGFRPTILALALLGLCAAGCRAQDGFEIAIIAPHGVGFGILFDVEVRRSFPEELVVDALDLSELRPLDLVSTSMERSVSSGRVTEVHRLRARAFVLDSLILGGVRLAGRRGDEVIEALAPSVEIVVTSALADDDPGRAEAPEGPMVIPPRPRDRSLLLLVALGFGIGVSVVLWLSRRGIEARRARRAELSPKDRFRRALELSDAEEGRDRAAGLSRALRELLLDLGLVAGESLALEHCLTIAPEAMGQERRDRLARLLRGLEDLAYRAADPGADELQELRVGVGDLGRELIAEGNEEAAE